MLLSYLQNPCWAVCVIKLFVESFLGACVIRLFDWRVLVHKPLTAVKTLNISLKLWFASLVCIFFKSLPWNSSHRVPKFATAGLKRMGVGATSSAPHMAKAVKYGMAVGIHLDLYFIYICGIGFLVPASIQARLSFLKKKFLDFSNLAEFFHSTLLKFMNFVVYQVQSLMKQILRSKRNI